MRPARAVTGLSFLGCVNQLASDRFRVTASTRTTRPKAPKGKRLPESSASPRTSLVAEAGARVDAQIAERRDEATTLRIAALPM